MEFLRAFIAILDHFIRFRGQKSAGGDGFSASLFICLFLTACGNAPSFSLSENQIENLPRQIVTTTSLQNRGPSTVVESDPATTTTTTTLQTNDKACVSQAPAPTESGCANQEQNQNQEWPESLFQETKRLMRMEMKQNCHPTVIDGMNMLDCQYVTGGAGQTIHGHAVLMDVTQKMWMNWVGNACEKITSVDPETCHKKVINRILMQSGGQIPWSGNVYEDQTPADGIFEAYCFRNGIGIGVSGLGRWMPRDVTVEEFSLCTKSPDIVRSGLYPRPIGLSLADYARSSRGAKLQAYLNPEGKGNALWLEIVRKTLIEAYHSRENFFITEWARLYVR